MAMMMMKNNFVGWFYFLISFMVLGWAAFAYDTTTGNLINQDFTNNSWSGTNQSIRHGNNTIAGVDNKYVESTISLRDTLTQEQINGGFQSALGADIWFWNTREQSVVMKQTIGGTTQIRTIDRVDGYYNTYTDTIVVNENTVTDYDVNVRFEFNESGNSNYHYAADLKNPTLIVTYWNNPVQPEVIEEIEEVLDEFIEWETEFVEPVIEQPTFVPPVFEETFLEEFVLEEPQTIVVLEEEFQTLEEEFEEVEILQVFGGPEIVEEPQEEETIREPAMETVATSLMEEQSEPTETTPVETVPEEVASEPSGPSNEPVAMTEPQEESEEEEYNEPTVTTETFASNETAEEENTVEEPKGETNSLQAEIKVEEKETTEIKVDVDSITAKVETIVKDVDKQLAVISVVTQRVMISKAPNLSNYTAANADLFQSQLFYSPRNYNDSVDLSIYESEIYTDGNVVKQIVMNDPVYKYQEDLRTATFNRIEAERQLMEIRGY
jgi:hypothetical protein